MVEAVKAEIGACADAAPLRKVFATGRAHIVGTSGAITSLAGLHLRPAALRPRQVDGLWMTRGECPRRPPACSPCSVAERAAEPCIGPDRADLVLAGAAILQAVQELWPCERVRVADRGLREGLLLSLMASPAPAPARRVRRRRRRGRPSTERTAAQAHGAPADRRDRRRARRAQAAEDRQGAHALVAGLAGAPDQRSLRRRGQGQGLSLPRRLQADRDRRPLPSDPPGRAGDRPGLRARRLAAGRRGARRGAGGGRRPAAGRPARRRDDHRDGLHRPGLRPAADRAARRRAGPDPLRHGPQHHRPPADRPPAHRRPDRGGGRLRAAGAEARRRLRHQGVPGRRDRRRCSTHAEARTSPRCGTSSPRPAARKAPSSIWWRRGFKGRLPV